MMGVMTHQYILLVFRKYRKNITEEEEKEGKFPVVTKEADIVGDYVWIKKSIKYVASSF